MGKTKIQSLHSTVLGEEDLSEYKDEFDTAFSENDITNIAVSGPYGAGKSTIVNSWEETTVKKGRTRPWIHISLAGFHGEGKRNVEAELINQLVHKLANEKAPKSRFVVTQDGSVVRDVGKSLFIASFFVLSVMTAMAIDNINNLEEIPKKIVALYLAWSICFLMIIYQVIRRKLVTRTLKRLKFLNAEVELFDSVGDEDVFDRHLDDIVYLLSSVKSEVVVFEDLDRFNDITIFEKLRRANDLANVRRASSRSMDKKIRRPVRFIYLVKDSLFADPKDRTKFFDLIIPVVPFVDPSNAFDVLKTSFRGTEVEPSDEFLYQLSLYVDDPRILKDICNESQHYKEELFKDKSLSKEMGRYWSDDRLVAMTAYKVLFPKDYELLQIRDGYVFSRFQKKQLLVQNLTAEIHKEITQLEQKIEEIDLRAQLNEYELSLLYGALYYSGRYRIAEKLNNCGRKDFDSVEELVNHLISQLSKDQSFSQTLGNLKDSQNGNVEFLERLSEASKKCGSISSRVSERITSLESDVLDLERKRLEHLLSDQPELTEHFLRDELDEKQHDMILGSRYFGMLRFLLIQGYINEDYQLYMSNRYNEALTPKDEEFLYALLGGYSTSYSWELDNPESVILRLPSDALARSAARNWSIFKCLVSQGDSEKLQSFLRGIERDRDSKFVSSYILSDQYTDDALVSLGSRYQQCLNDILVDEGIGDERKRAICHIVMGAKIARPVLDAGKDALRKFASQDSGFLSLESWFSGSQTSLLKTSLTDIDYRAELIDFEKADSCLLTFVATEGLFLPTHHNVLGLSRALSQDSLSVINLNSWLASSNDEDVLLFREHVLASKDVYIATLIDSSSSGPVLLNDSDEAIAMVLNEPFLENDVMEGYISSLANPVSDLSLIDLDAARSGLVRQGKCIDSRRNIATYLDVPGFDQDLATMLNHMGVPDALSADYLRSSGINPSQFISDCVRSDLIDGHTLVNVAEIYGETIDDFKLPNQDSGRIEILINSGILSVTKNNLMNMRQNYPNLVAKFAAKDLDSYVQLVVSTEDSSCSFSKEEALELFAVLPQLDVGRLVSLAEECDGDTALSPNYPDEVNRVLLRRKSNRSNFNDLPRAFGCAGDTLKTEIVELAVDFLEKLSAVELGNDFEMAIASKLKNNPSAAKQFIFNQINFNGTKMTRDLIRDLFIVSGLDEYVKLMIGPSSRIAISRTDRGLLQALTNFGMCGKMGEVGDDGKTLVYSKGYNRSR